MKGFRGVDKDITDHKRADREREELETRLQQAYKMEAIGTLAGGIAHDFNNILSIMIGFTQLGIAHLREDKHVGENLERVVEAGMRARDLVSHILTFSRQSEQKFEAVDIGLIIKEVIKLLRAAMPANIEIRLDKPEKCCTVHADSVQIHQIIMNLCTNAFHAIGDKKGHIGISVAHVEIGPGDFPEPIGMKHGRYLKISVADNGSGMDRVTLGKVFDPYFTTKKKGEGTGMGLAVVHGIVKKHRGYITAKSEPGRGTSFLVYLPCVNRHRPMISEPLENKIPRGSEHILVVDDEKHIGEMLEDLLGDLGYRVTIFRDAGQALDLFRTGPRDFDLVLTDMRMPEMSGEELSCRIRETDPRIPIIIQTGFSEHLSGEKLKIIGVDALLKKPVLERELAECIRNVIDKKKQRGAFPS